MNKHMFAASVKDLNEGDRVRVQLRDGCFKRTDDFAGAFTGKVIEKGPGLLGIAVAREGIRWFTFYPVESITRLKAAKGADA